MRVLWVFGIKLLSSPETGKGSRPSERPAMLAALLGRRLGGALLRRAAYRASHSPGLPDAARDALVAAPTALADAIEPPLPETDLEADSSRLRAR